MGSDRVAASKYKYNVINPDSKKARFDFQINNIRLFIFSDVNTNDQ
jgi:hypothetical protein